MRFVLIFACVGFAVAYEHHEIQIEKQHEAQMRNELAKTAIQLVDVYKKDKNNLKDIPVLLDEFVDRLFANLRIFMINNNFDDVGLPNETFSLDPAGHMNLFNGSLRGFDSISRTDDDVILTYHTEEQKTVFVLAFLFKDLGLAYNYHTKALLLSINGGMTGSIKKPTFNTQISFNLKNYSFFLDHLDMQDTGAIDVKFSGNGLIDWLTNAMSTVVTTLLHPIAVGQVQKLLRNVLRQFIEKLNEEIANILNPIP